MPRFSQMLKDRGLEVSRRPEQREEDFEVQNVLLDSCCQGIKYRRSPDLSDIDASLPVASFGTVVRGIATSDSEWLQVGDRYLPMKIKATTVLFRVQDRDVAPEEPEPSRKRPGSTIGKLPVMHRVEMPSTMPDELGKGAIYEVVGKRIFNRAAPSQEAAVQGSMRQGQLVELFEWDRTREWRRCVDPKYWISGWMMLDHPELGPLLRPQGMGGCKRPLKPMCEAARENYINMLSEFIQDGLEVNTLDENSQRTPLELAAVNESLDCCVLLLQSGAALGSEDIMTGWPKLSAALVRALTGRIYDLQDFEAALATLSPVMRQAADTLFDKLFEDLNNRLAKEEKPVLIVLPALYEVVFSSVHIRRHPSLSSDSISRRMQGERVVISEYDQSGEWGKVEISLGKQGSVYGWMALYLKGYGRLLEPVQQ